MFGHRDDDVISKDQQADVDVSIPDDAMSAMALPPDPSALVQQNGTDDSQTQMVQPDEQQTDDTPSATPEPASDPFTPAPSAPALEDTDTPSEEPAQPDQAPMLSGFMQPSALDTTETSEEATTNDIENTETGQPAVVEPQEDTSETGTPERGAAVMPQSAGSEDLLHIKQDALEQLSPLVDQLEQEPEQKFRTLLMLIQASDNQELVSHAYKVALQIKDEKVRAQALLDVVNEINYFTHEGQKPEEKNSL